MPRPKKRLGGKCFDDLMTQGLPFWALLLHTFLQIPEAESPQKVLSARNHGKCFSQSSGQLSEFRRHSGWAVGDPKTFSAAREGENLLKWGPETIDP